MLDTIITQRCSHCKIEKPLSEFYKSNTLKTGVYPVCKSCAYIANHSEQHRESSRKTTAAYRQTELGKYRIKLYDTSPEGKLAYARYKAKNAIKVRAHMMLNHAIRAGKMPPISSQVCMTCGRPAEDWHHFLGYEPEHILDVQPLCKPCHKLLHRKSATIS